MLQTDLWGFYDLSTGGEEGSNSRRDECLNRRQPLGAGNSDLSVQDIAKGAIRGCGRNFQFFEKSRKGVVEFGKILLKVPELLKAETSRRGEETYAELIV